MHLARDTPGHKRSERHRQRMFNFSGKPEKLNILCLCRSLRHEALVGERLSAGDAA